MSRTSRRSRPQVPGRQHVRVRRAPRRMPRCRSSAASTRPASRRAASAASSRPRSGPTSAIRPIDGYFQLDDLKQVEVLRGPQGTLYGAGTLAGALRLIPNSPELNTFSGEVEASGGRLDHSDGTPYALKGLVNVPLGRRARIPRIGEVRLRARIRQHLRPVRAHQQRPVGHPAARESRPSPVTSPADLPGQARLELSRRPSPGARACCGSRPRPSAPKLRSCTRTAVGDGGPQVNPRLPGRHVAARSFQRPCLPAGLTGSSRRSISPGRATRT